MSPESDRSVALAPAAPTETAAPTTQPPPGHPRFPRIDSLRAIAALLIVAYHVAFQTGSLTYGWASNFTLALQVGVPIFFAISGFVLYRPFVASRHGAPGRSIATYGRSRFLRIMPAYWVALTLAAFYPGLSGVFTADWWRYYGLLQTYDSARQFAGLPVAWSLCVEVTFYLALPLYALAMTRVAGSGRHWLRIELAVLAVLSVASIAAWAQTSLLTLPVTFSWFAVGMAAAVLSVAGWDGWWAARRPGLVWLLALVVGVAYGYVLGPRSTLGLQGTGYRTVYMLMSTAIPLLVLGPAIWGTRGLPQRALSWRWLAWLGAISYGIYLYHLPVLLAIQRLGLEDLVPGQSVLSYVLVGVPVAIGLAAVSFYVLERPALSLRSRPLFWPRGDDAPAARPWPWSRQLLFAFGAITLGSLLLYVAPVVHLGFYYDDWLLQSAFTDAASGSFSDLFTACRDIDRSGRFGGCLYHSAAYTLLGGNPGPYHVASIVLLVASTTLIYVLLRRCRLGHWPALLVCALYVVYPGSDATRLWPTSIGAQYILGAYVAGVLLGIAGLRRRGWRAAACHAGSLALFVLLVFTYEVVLPLIAVTCVFYLLAVEDRRAALKRGAVDLALAVAFTAYRLLLDPVDASAGFVRERSTGESIDHLRAVLHGASRSWQTLFLPGTVAAVAVAAAVVVVVVATATDAKVRRDVGRWLAIGAAAGAFAVLAVLPYAAAEDLYVPDAYSLFNRLNIASAPAYCLLFVALAAALWAALRRWLPKPGATIAVGVLVMAVAASQAATARDSQAVWAKSWDAQQAAIRGLELAALKLPPRPAVMSFGHPLWERGFIPVFSSSWDMRGAIDVKTRVDPAQGMPFVDTAVCGPQATLVAGKPFERYTGGPSSLWFVNAATGEARRITSRRTCEATVAQWGRPPFFGASVNGPA